MSALTEQAREALERVKANLVAPTDDPGAAQAQEDAIAADAVLVVGNLLLSIAESLETIASQEYQRVGDVAVRTSGG